MYLDFYKNSFFSYFFIYIIKVLLVFERSQSERIQTTTIYIYITAMCTIYWEFICFVLFFGQISIRVHCICFFFLQKLQHDFPKYQGLCSFSCLVFVCLPLFCYLINQSSYVIIKVEITRLLLLFNFNGICLHYDWLHSRKING